MASGKQKIPLSVLHDYCRTLRGMGIQLGESPVVVAAALVANELGEVRVSNARKYVEANALLVRSTLAQAKKDGRYVPSNAKLKKADEAVGTGQSAASWLMPDGVDVRTDAFLQTYAWKKVRMQALLQWGARCMCCGATPSSGAIMNVDHIKCRRRFPELALALDNLQILCGDCNHGKGNWDMTDWRPGGTAPAADQETRMEHA